jgi:hypothetical protein
MAPHVRKGKGRHDDDGKDPTTASAATDRAGQGTSTTGSRHADTRNDDRRTPRSEPRQQHNPTAIFPRSRRPEGYSYSESDESHESTPRHAEALIRLNPAHNSWRWRDFIRDNPDALEDEEDSGFYFAEAIDALKHNNVARAQSCVRIGVVLRIVGGKKPSKYDRFFDVLAGDVVDKAVSESFESHCNIYFNDCKARAKPRGGNSTNQAQGSSRHDEDEDPADKFKSLSLTQPSGPPSRPQIGRDKDPVDVMHGQKTGSVRKPSDTGIRPRHLDEPKSSGGGGRPTQLASQTTSAGGQTEIALGELDREPSITGPKASAADEDSIDDRFIRRDAKKAGNFFKLHRVFAILEHVEAEKDSDDDTQAKYRSKVRGITVLSHVRHFAVVREGHGFCWAVPINTYKGQGLNKPGLRTVYAHIYAHAIIYSTSRPPAPLPQEPRMSKDPIAVELGQNADPLKPSSRINFAQVHTIQHNVRAMNIGKIRETSWRHFDAYWREHLLRVR